jgi:hypothetical protein
MLTDIVTTTTCESATTALLMTPFILGDYYVLRITTSAVPL